MKNLRKILFLFLFAGFLIYPAKAQDDFGGSVEVKVSKKIIKGLSFSLEEELRMRDNFQAVDRFSTIAELSYKLNNYLKFGGAYNLINYNHPTKDWETRHRYYVYATGSYQLDRFTFSLRERFQSTHRVGVSETAKRANPKYYLRSRLDVEYNIRKSPFEPYASVELYNTLNDPQGNGVDRIRYTGGCKYKLNKQHALQLYYRYISYTDDDDYSKHMIGMGYSFKF